MIPNVMGNRFKELICGRQKKCVPVLQISPAFACQTGGCTMHLLHSVWIIPQTHHPEFSLLISTQAFKKNCFNQYHIYGQVIIYGRGMTKILSPPSGLIIYSSAPPSTLFDALHLPSMYGILLEKSIFSPIYAEKRKHNQKVISLKEQASGKLYSSFKLVQNMCAKGKLVPICRRPYKANTCVHGR